MSIPNGEIRFKPRTLLRVDEFPIESSDVDASDLYTFINSVADIISSHIEHSYKSDLIQARRPELKQRPAIQIARLALHEWDRSVFNTLNMQEVSTVTTSPNLLLPHAREYWSAVEQTMFVPEIHIRGIRALKDTRGVWLSLRVQTKN